MGLAEIRELVKPVIKEVDLTKLSGKIVALDAFNTLYQFITAIRQPDGTPLMDSKGRITSHLSGLFYRTKNLLENRIKVIFVFDGKSPEFKQKEISIREEIKKKMETKYKEAIELGIRSDARKYAEASARLTKDMIKDAIELIEAMGLPWIQAPSEGEAQAAYLVKKGYADFVGSQDYDSLLFGAPAVLRNIVISGRRKVRGVEVDINPEIIRLDDVLSYLKISREQLIFLALIVGTDYNPDGIKGIGIKSAYEIVKKFNEPEKLFNYVGWKKYYPDIDWNVLYEFFIDPPVTDDFEIKFGDIDEKRIIDILVNEHDFNEERVKKAIDELKKAIRQGSQSNITSFFKK